MGRIGIVCYSLAGGGAERMAVHLAREFNTAGFMVDFLLAKREGEFLEKVCEDFNVFSAAASGARNWRLLIQGYIQDYSPSVLLGMMEGSSVIACQAARRSQKPCPVIARIPNHFSRHCRESLRWKERWLMPLAARFYFSRVKHVIAISDGVRDDIILSARLRPENVSTIYNPVLLNGYTSQKGSVDDPWLLPAPGWISVVTAGRLCKQKQQEILIEAIALANQVSSTRLLVLGKGERESELKNLCRELQIEDRVKFMGFVENPSLYIEKYDVFVLSSAWEGFGNVLVEALFSGTAVVSTDCPSGPSEILASGRFGQLVPVGDSQAMSDALIRAKTYPVDKAALNQHLQMFESKYVAKQYLQVMGLETP